MIYKQQQVHRRKPRPKCAILSQFWQWLNKWIFLCISLTVLTNARKFGRNLTILVTFLNPIAVHLTNVLSMDARHWFAITSVSFQTANLIGLILHHNVGVIILDTDTLWTQTATI